MGKNVEKDKIEKDEEMVGVQTTGNFVCLVGE